MGRGGRRAAWAIRIAGLGGLLSGALVAWLGSNDQAVALAAGSVPLAALAGRTITVHLRATPALLADDGYAVRLTGSVTLILRRGRVTQNVFRAPGP